MKNEIIAIINKNFLGSKWGFSFNTDIQSHVENFMLRCQYTTDDYYLCFKKDAPDGVYTDVIVKEIKDNNDIVNDVKFEL